MRIPPKGLLYLFLLGALGGLLGESVLFLRAHCAKVEALLAEDFKAVIFLSREVNESRRKVVEERLLALPLTAEVRYISPQDSLAELGEGDPDFAGTAALLGDAPLPGAFEAAFDNERLGGFDDWLNKVRAIPEVRDVRYKTLQAAAILQARFYVRFLTIVVCSAVLAWGVGLAGFLLAAGWEESALRRATGPYQETWTRIAATGLGTLTGMACALSLALPAMSDGGLRAWPPWSLQFLLAAVGAVSGTFYHGPAFAGRTASRGREGASRSGSGLVAAAVAFVLCALAAKAGAAGVRSQQQELQKVKNELQLKKQALERVRREEKAIQRDLKNLKQQEDRANDLLRRLERRRSSKDNEWQALDGKLSALKTAHEEGRHTLAQEVHGYRRRRAERVDYYGSRDLWEGALRRAAIKKKTVYLARLGDVSQQVSARRLLAQNEGRSLRARSRRTVTELLGQRMRVDRAEKAYASAREKTSLTLLRIHELEENAKAIAALIKKLRKKTSSVYKPVAAVPSFGRHTLPWPAEGEISSTFGKKRVPELQTWVIQNGIEIDTPPGAAVYPIAKGEVIYAGEFRSYGRVVIVDHGGEFVSIYGQLGKILKKNGDRVGRGQALGEAGTNRNVQKGSLYLELRQGHSAIDPTQWLKTR